MPKRTRFGVSKSQATGSRQIVTRYALIQSRHESLRYSACPSPVSTYCSGQCSPQYWKVSPACCGRWHFGRHRYLTRRESRRQRSWQ
ncbi:hypothetical protein PT2222_200169 [Paraburkholderia tropica]